MSVVSAVTHLFLRHHKNVMHFLASSGFHGPETCGDSEKQAKPYWGAGQFGIRSTGQPIWYPFEGIMNASNLFPHSLGCGLARKSTVVQFGH